MQELPSGWIAWCALVFVLGMKHGLDPDHLAAIDGLTRYNARNNAALARACGLLFSLGHGLVVVGIAVGVALGVASLQPTAGAPLAAPVAPVWLATAGAVVSIGFLTLLGVINLRAVLAAPAGQVARLQAIRGRLLGGVTRAGRPAAVALVGALFAVSYDTVSQATLFALSAAAFGGVERALVLGVLFALGMVVTDGLNGWWVSRWIERTDRLAVIASRVMGGAIGVASLLLAGWGVARLALPQVDAWSADRELFFSAIVAAVVAASYLLARRLAARDIAARLAAE
jgi:high-affinity nickel-transport protein